MPFTLLYRLPKPEVRPEKRDGRADFWTGKETGSNSLFSKPISQTNIKTHFRKQFQSRFSNPISNSNFKNHLISFWFIQGQTSTSFHNIIGKSLELVLTNTKTDPLT